MCELQMYSQVAMDLASGKYFSPIIHGYGIPFIFHYLIGKLATVTHDPIFATGQFQFVMDSTGIISIYLLGKSLFDRRVGLVSAFLFCFSPIYTTFAVVITVASAAFHIVGYVFLARVITKGGRLNAALAGFCFGMPDGGGRFSPFIVTAAAVCLWFMISDKSRRRNALKWLGIGFIGSMAPMIAYSSQHVFYLISMLYAFTGKGFEHVEMSRPIYSELLQKISEFGIHFFVFNPLCALPLLLVFSKWINLLFRRRLRLEGSEKFLLYNISVLSFFLTFVMTYTEPSEVFKLPARPLRYFFIFTPLLEVLSAHWIVGMLDRRRSLPGKSAKLFAGWNLRRGYIGLAGLAVFVALLPPLYAENRVFRDFRISRPTTVLSNLTPSQIFSTFRSYSFGANYAELLELNPGYGDEIGVKAMEFYARFMFKEALREHHEYMGIPVEWKSWFLNFPVFPIEALTRCGVVAGLPRDTIFYLMRKERLGTVQSRYRERPFSEAFAAQVDDWDLFRSFNPRTDLSAYILSQDGDVVVARIPIPFVRFHRVRFRFDRRDVRDPNTDFVVPASLVFLDELGFGWRTAANLSDPGDWTAIQKNRTGTTGVQVDPLIRNHFRVRVADGRYAVRLEWAPGDDVPGEPFRILGDTLLEHAETTELPDGRRVTTGIVMSGNEIVVDLAYDRTFTLFGFALEPVPVAP